MERPEGPLEAKAISGMLCTGEHHQFSEACSLQAVGKIPRGREFLIPGLCTSSTAPAVGPLHGMTVAEPGLHCQVRNSPLCQQKATAPMQLHLQSHSYQLSLGDAFTMILLWGPTAFRRLHERDFFEDYSFISLTACLEQG